MPRGIYKRKKGWKSPTSFKKGHIPWSKGKKNPLVSGDRNPMKRIEVRLKVSKFRRGEKSNFWKGGISPINDRLRKSGKYKEWRKSIFQRDNWTCQVCKIRGGEIQADHYPRTFSSILNKLKIEKGIENLYNNAFEYEPLWEINNGRTLCRKCHLKTETFGGNSGRNKNVLGSG